MVHSFMRDPADYGTADREMQANRQLCQRAKRSGAHMEQIRAARVRTVLATRLL